MNNNKGITLVELIIYIVLFTIVSLLVGSQVKTMLRSYTNGRRMSNIQSNSRDVLAMLGREIKNTGFKVYLTNDGTNAWTRHTETGVILADNSSFLHKSGDPGDTLIIYKVKIDNAGVYQGIETIKLYLSGTILKRNSATTTWDLAENVYALQFQYGVFAVQQLLLDQEPIVLNSWSPSWNCTKSTSGSSMLITSSNGSTTGHVTCTQRFAISSDCRITIAFDVSAHNGFPSALNWVEWQIINASGTLITSERFKPRNTRNSIKIPVLQEGNARVQLQFNSSGIGELLVKDVVVMQVDQGSYTWTDNPTIAQKKAVRAIRILLLTRSNGEGSTKESGSITVGDVSVTRSGNYSWRLYTEIIETPNNGLNN